MCGDRRSWGGSVENASVPVAIGVDDTGHREVIGVAEGMKEDKASRGRFIRSMIERGLKGVGLVVGDGRAGLVATVGEMLPQAGYQRCMVHFMRNVLSKVPPTHREWASAAPEAILAMESRASALAKAEEVAREMESRRLKAAASCLREGIGETTTWLLDEYPPEHRRRIRTNNMIRTPQQGDPPAHQGRRQLPRRQERAHAHLRQDPIRHRQRLVEPPLPGHVPTRRHHAINRLKLSSRQRAEPLLRKTSGTT